MCSILKALKSAGIPAPNKNTESFEIVRWGKNNRYWLRKFNGGYIFGDFVKGISNHVFDQDYKGERKTRAVHAMELARQSAEIALNKIHQHAAHKAYTIWHDATYVKNHPYLEKKRVLSYGLKEYRDNLVVPLNDNSGNLCTLQFIDLNGHKRFLSGGKKNSGNFIVGDINNAVRAFICEGYATGATIHECTGETVIIAFDAGNLKPVAQTIREKYPDLKLIFCADNDAYGDVNTGLEKAQEAAKAVNATVIAPTFKDVTTKPTDFNDLFILEGKQAVVATLNPVIENDVPEGFMLSDEGLYCFDKKTAEPIRISNYIKVTAFIRTQDEISRLIEFKDYKGELLKIIIKPKMFTYDGEQIRIKLLSKGFVFVGSSFSKRKLIEYISSSVPSKEATLISRCGFHENVYIRPDCVIGTEISDIILDDSLQDKAIKSAGSLKDWNSGIAQYCEGNSRLIFAVSAAFASVLLKSCEIPNFGFHFVGNSSSGKTTSLNVAASVFGNQDYVVSWKTTDNALENTAIKRNDALLILDELSEVSPIKAGDIAYMLANGQGKQRLDKNCNARETLFWRLIFLSSGEVDLNAHMSEANKASKAGQKVRFLNIPVKAFPGSFGIFEDLHNFQDGAEFSSYLRGNASKYYGTASIAFIEKVLEHSDEIRREFKEEFQRLKAKYLPADAEGQDMRAFEHFMLVGFAGELAIKYGVVCWKAGTSYNAAVACFNSWLEDKEGVGDDENRQILEHVKAFFELHAHSRFFDLDGVRDQKISNMAGYKSVYKDAVTFFVSPSVFQNEICKSFSRKAVIALLIEKGFLLKDRNGDYRQQKWTPYGNKKVYVISGRILLGE